MAKSAKKTKSEFTNRSNEDKQVIRMNLLRPDYCLDHLSGKIRINEEVIDYIAEKCIQMIMGKHG